MPRHLRAVAAHAFLRAEGPRVGQQNTDGAPSGARRPVAARAQQARPAKASAKPAVEGRNVTAENDWLEGQYDQLPSLMADLVRRRVAVIVEPQRAMCAKKKGGHTDCCVLR